MNEVILYILMRTDMKSMNAGKAMAQASHASNAAVMHARADDKNTLLKHWESSTSQGFGTVLVLDGGTIENIRDKIEEINAIGTLKNESFVAGVVHDPTYPLLDGKTVHYIPVDTCAYVMCYKNSKIADELKEFKLHA